MYYGVICCLLLCGQLLDRYKLSFYTLMVIDGVTGSTSQHSLSDYKQAEIPADGDVLLSEQQMLPAAHKVSDDEEQFRPIQKELLALLSACLVA